MTPSTADAIPAQAIAPAAAPDSARVDAFARAYVQSKNYAAAYRATFDASGMAPQSVWNAASQYAKQPHVVARVRALLEDAAKATIVTVAELLQHQYEIATADPREVVWTTEHACRHCWGNDGLYQWRDVEEFDLACAKAIDDAVRAGGRDPESGAPRESVAFPSIAGGIGYTLHREPNPGCESCAGVGTPRVHVRDMRSLTGPAAKLIKGVKQDRFGAITVELHDQQKALDACNRIVGAYKDALTVHPGPTKAEPLPADLPAAQVAERYLDMVR